MTRGAVPEWVWMVTVAVGILSVVANIVLVVLTAGYTRSAKKQAEAAKEQANAAQQQAAAAREQADAAKEQAKQAQRSADASERANVLAREHGEADSYERAISGLLEVLEKGWHHERVQAFLDNLPLDLDRERVIRGAHPRWKRADREVEVLLRSHGFLPKR